MRDPSYCILVNSCDAYEDCWEPFFTLLTRYWPSIDQPIYLNTETKAFAFRDLSIVCPRAGLEARHALSWSEHLRRCLDVLPCEIVLYLQEDYFLTGSVDGQEISRLAELMRIHAIDHIGLERGLTAIPGVPTQHRFLSSIGQRVEYRISLQAGLWRVPVLRSYLRRRETVWEFEWYGSRRAWRRNHSFLHVNADYEREHGRRMFPYHPTGIVQGRWVRDVVVELFAANGIEVDFTARGFHEDARPPRRPAAPIRAVRRARSIL